MAIPRRASRRSKADALVVAFCTVDPATDEDCVVPSTSPMTEIKAQRRPRFEQVTNALAFATPATQLLAGAADHPGFAMSSGSIALAKDAS